MKPDKVPAELLRHPVADYLSCDPYWGDEEEVRLRKTEIVRPRQATHCNMGLRGRELKEAEHPVGAVMWKESGLIEGSFASNHVCLPHIAITIDFNNCGDRDPYEFTCAEAAKYVPPLEEDEEDAPCSPL